MTSKVLSDGDQVILNTSDEAAKFVWGMHGWVDRHGRFWGNDERLARWNGCTHTVCVCGTPVEKSWTLCEDCRDKAARKRYQKRETKAYDGSPVYSEKYNEYFLTLEDMDQYCYEHLGVASTDDVKPEDLLLRSCDPVYAHEIDPEEYYHSESPDDEGSLPKEVAEAFEELNSCLVYSQIFH